MLVWILEDGRILSLLHLLSGKLYSGSGLPPVTPEGVAGTTQSPVPDPWGFPRDAELTLGLRVQLGRLPLEKSFPCR